jgi:hypothetical protein
MSTPLFDDFQMPPVAAATYNTAGFDGSILDVVQPPPARRRPDVTEVQRIERRGRSRRLLSSAPGRSRQ